LWQRQNCRRFEQEDRSEPARVEMPNGYQFNAGGSLAEITHVFFSLFPLSQKER